MKYELYDWCKKGFETSLAIPAAEVPRLAKKMHASENEKIQIWRLEEEYTQEAPELPSAYSKKGIYPPVLNLRIDNLNRPFELHKISYDQSELVLYKVSRNVDGQLYTEEIEPEKVPDLPKGTFILTLPSDLSKFLETKVRLRWGMNGQLEFWDEEEYYYVLGLLCYPDWFDISVTGSGAYKIKCLNFVPSAFEDGITDRNEIYNNDYIRDNLMVKHNFTRIGKRIYRDFLEVRKTVPAEYLRAFDSARERHSAYVDRMAEGVFETLKRV